MKWIKWIVALALVLAVGFFIYSGKQCTLDGSRACYNAEVGTFEVEEHASLSVQVENEALKGFLETEWARLHPNSELIVSVQPVLSLSELQELPYDVMVVSQENAAFFIPEFQDLGSNAGSIIGSRIPVNLQDAMNLKGFYMAQNSVSGPLFVYNETLSEQLEMNPIQSMEDLLNQGDLILSKIRTVLPFSFKDQESFYPFLTIGGWSLNSSHVGSKSGVDSTEFLAALNFIATLSDGDTLGRDLPWNFESDFFAREALVSLLPDRDLASQYAVASGDTYRFMPALPYKGVHMAPQASVRGYVVKKDLGFTSAATEVLRILRLPEAIGLNDFFDFVPIYHGNHMDELNLTQDRYDLVNAYSYSVAVPIIALENNKSVLARRAYVEVPLMDVLADVYDRTITPEEGQEIIVKRWNDWLEVNNVVE